MTISNFVAYVKQAWKNKPDTSTPLSAPRLLHMEDGIKMTSDAIEKIAAAVVSQIVNDPDKIASMAALYAVDQKIGNVANLPNGAADVVAAITQQNSNFLNISGGTLTGQLRFKDGYGSIEAYDSNVLLRTMVNKGIDSTSRRISIYNSNEIRMALQLIDTIDGENKNYEVFGSHNKPSGSYKGNGSATSRTISTGGIGSVIKIDGNDGMAIISRHGGICKNGSAIVAIPLSEAKFIDGVLTLATTNNVLNNNGSTCYWQVL